MRSECNFLINVHGEDKTKIHIMEELSELQKEICKDFRGIKNDVAIHEEIIDCYISLIMAMEIYGLNQEYFEKLLKFKMEKNKKRARSVLNG